NIRPPEPGRHVRCCVSSAAQDSARRKRRARPARWRVSEQVHERKRLRAARCRLISYARKRAGSLPRNRDGAELKVPEGAYRGRGNLAEDCMRPQISEGGSAAPSGDVKWERPKAHYF